MILTRACWLIALCCLAACGKAPAPSSAVTVPGADSVVSAQDRTPPAPDSVAVLPSNVPPVPVKMSPSDAPQTLRAQFVELQMGDYAHLVVRDAAGQRRSFYLADELPYSAWADLDTLPGMKGKQLELTWRHVEKYLEAAGGTEAIDEVTGIRYR